MYDAMVNADGSKVPEREGESEESMEVQSVSEVDGFTERREQRLERAKKLLSGDGDGAKEEEAEAQKKVESGK